MQEHTSLWVVFFSEVTGTGMLIFLGTGVVANVLLKRSKGEGAGWLTIAFGWGLAVFAGVIVAAKSGAHLNPAVTVGLLANGSPNYAPGVPVSLASTLVYFAGEFLGAFIGAIACWLVYKKHFDQDNVPGEKLAVFSTGPAIRSYGWNLLTEIGGTFVLVFAVVGIGSSQGDWPSALGPLPVALIVLGIGVSLGGPTGYAINPARDLGPRIAHALLPIPGKGPGDWAYSWVPVLGPLIGGAAAGLLGRIVLA